MSRLTQRNTPAFAKHRLTLAVLVALAPALPTLAAEGSAETTSTATEAVVMLAAVEEINIFGTKRNSVRELPTLRGPVIDMPQLVSTVTAETLKDRQINSLEDALRNVAGITTQIGEGGVVNGDQFFIRGQSAKSDIFTDGLRDFGAFTRDSFNFENISVLKGPSSTALGRGVSGGAINSGSKLPMGENFTALGGGVGTADYRRVAVDSNVAFNETSAARVNVMVHENSAPDRDVINSERWGIAPSIAFGIGTDTSFSAIYLHQEEDRIPDYGVPVITTAAADDIELPVTEYGVRRENFYGYANADTDEVSVDTLTLLFNHQFSETLSLSSGTKLGQYDRYFRQTVASCPAATCGAFLIDNDPATVPLASMGGPGPYDQSTRGIQNVTTLLYTQSLGERRNELAIGWDVSYQTNDRTQFNYSGTRAAKDLFTPSHSPLPVLASGYNNIRESNATDLALVVDDRLWVTPTLSFNVGVRVQQFRNEQDQLNFAAAGATLTTCNGVTGTFNSCFVEAESDSNLVNPKVAAIWEPSDRASVYLSYGRSSLPPGNSVGNGDTLATTAVGNLLSANDLDPEKSATVDLGIKYALFEDRLLLQAGIYQTDRSNSKQDDPQSGNTIVSAQPGQRLRGIELGASGTITDDVLVNVNYSHINTEVTESYTGTPPVLNTAVLGKEIIFVPADSASAWVSWEPTTGWMQNLKIGGGFNYQSKIYLNLQNLQETPSYTSVDMLIGYNFDNVSLSLNANNLTDEKFYSQVNGGRVVPAAGRNFIASLQYNF